MQCGSRRGQTLLDRLEKTVDPLARFGRNQKARPLGRAAGCDIPDVLTLVRRKPIDLVPDFKDALSTGRIDAELAQYGFDILLLRFRVLVRDIPDMEDDVGFEHFLA